MAPWNGWQCLSVGRSVHHFGPDWNISRTIRWIAIKSGTEIHVAWKMNSNNFGDPLTSHLAPPAGQNFHLSSEISPTSTWWIGTKLCADIHGSRMMSPTDLLNPSLFLLCHHEVDVCGFEGNHQYFGLWWNTCKINDIPINCSCTLYLVLISKC